MTVRALLVGLGCVAILCIATPYTTGFMAASELGGCHFPVGPLLLLFALVLPISWITSKLRPVSHWSPAEKLYITAMMLVTAGLPTFGLALYIFPIMTAPYYMASAENKWAQAFFQHIPGWMAPQPGSVAVQWFYDGLPPGQVIPWGQWLVPLAAWTVLVVGLYLTMFAFGSIVRKQWIESENLVFPLVELPLEMALPQRRTISAVNFLRNPAVWVGFAIPFIIHNIEALRIYIPSMPEIKLHGIPLFPGLSGVPWRQLKSRIYVHFSVMGFAYFLTTEISLSVWFFWWFSKFQHLIADSLGRNPQLVKLDENQYQGAFAMIVIYGAWIARGHLKKLWAAVVSGQPPPDSEQGRPEAMSVRGEFAALAIGGAITIVWLSAAGMSVGWAAATFVLFLVICWGMARLVVESGILFAKATQMRPTRMFSAVVGAPAIPASDIAVLGFVEYVFMYDLKSFMMPQIMHSLKISDEAKMDRRDLYVALGLAVVVAILVSYWASLKVSYTKGALAMHPWFFINGPRGNLQRLKSFITTPEGWEMGRVVFMALGGAFTYFLIWMRKRFLWFPLHPIAYVIGNGYEASRMWFPFLIGWSVKAIVTHYGSVATYRSLRAPFLGLVLGEYSAAGLWLVIDALAGRTGHRIFP